jgi:hypothetical protein
MQKNVVAVMGPLCIVNPMTWPWKSLVFTSDYTQASIIYEDDKNCYGPKLLVLLKVKSLLLTYSFHDLNKVDASIKILFLCWW